MKFYKYIHTHRIYRTLRKNKKFDEAKLLESAKKLFKSKIKEITKMKKSCFIYILKNQARLILPTSVKGMIK